MVAANSLPCEGAVQISLGGFSVLIQQAIRDLESAMFTWMYFWLGAVAGQHMLDYFDALDAFKKHGITTTGLKVHIFPNIINISVYLHLSKNKLSL